MPKALTIAFLYLRTTFGDPKTLVMALAMPLIFTYVLGQAMGGAPTEGAPAVTLVVIDADGAALGGELTSRLAADPDLTLRILPAAEAAGWPEEPAAVTAAVVAAGGGGTLIIPTGFSTALLAPGAAELTFYANAAQARDAQRAEEAVRAAATDLDSVLRAAETSAAVAVRMGLARTTDALATYREAGRAQATALLAERPPIDIVVDTPGDAARPVRRVPSGYAQSSPGFLVMFGLAFVLTGIAVLLSEREAGTLRRLLVMPLRRSTVLLGKLLGIFIAALLQMALLIVLGAWLFDVPWGQSPVALAMMVSSFAFAVTGIGLLLGAVVRSRAQMGALRTLVVTSFAALGGAWWPLDIVPPWMRTLGHALPTAWAMDGFQDIIARGLGPAAVLAEAGILFAFGAISLLLGSRIFSYK